MNWIKVIGINMTLIFFTIVIVELSLGKWNDNDVPNLNYLILKKTYVDRSSIGIKPAIIALYPKKNGFRFDDNINFEKITDCLVITMGGSTTQEFILSQEETWSQKLQDELNINNQKIYDRCSGKYFVMNVGLSGHNIAANLWLLRNYIHDSKLNPLAIVVYQGINDWHTNLNSDSKYIPLRHLKYEIEKDIKYRSFIMSLVRRINESISVDLKNRTVDNNFNGDGFLFKLKKNEKIEGEFVYEKLNNNFIETSGQWGGVNYHIGYIKKFVDFTDKFFPDTKLIFITQTKPICDLRNFPEEFGYINTRNEKSNIPYDEFNKKEWLSNKGDCLRLGLIKSNYLSFNQENSKVKVIDYAGSYLEGLDESYDIYHKNPYGSSLFFNRVKKQLLCSIAFCSSSE